LERKKRKKAKKMQPLQANPVEDLAAVAKRWKCIEDLVTRNTLPFILVMFDGDYTTARQVVEGMGLYARKRLRKEGMVICLSAKDKRRVKIPKILLGNAKAPPTEIGCIEFRDHAAPTLRRK
jgi:hypothetical protein